MQESNVQTLSPPKRQAPAVEGTRTIVPAPPTPLIGRAEELEFACHELTGSSTRLLTITGPGGVGKTRLSLEIANRLAAGFADGATFISLAPVSDPTFVIASMAAALGLREDSSTSLIERLKIHLHDRHRLLVLDNFEQIIPAAPLVVELLSAAPQLRILVTSRAPLRVRGERELPLAPLALPDAQQPLHIDDAGQGEGLADSMTLFLQAASAVDPRFQLSRENAPIIAEICTRLDGLPLAIELAAARVRMLPPQNILARLGDRLALLTGGARDLPARQQTLRNAIAWSYELLEEHEKKTFRRLAVFSGGCTLEDAEGICGADNDATTDLLDVLASLLEKSMIRREDNPNEEPRFSMLETIRDYAREMLAASGEERMIRDRHAAHFAEIAEQSLRELAGAGQKTWLKKLDREHDNLRGALQWLLQSGDAVQAVKMSGALGRYWLMRTHLTEGRKWLKQCIAAATGSSTEMLGRALNQYGNLLWSQGYIDQAEEQYQRSLEVYRTFGNLQQTGIGLNNLGNIAISRGDVARAKELYNQSLTIRRSMGDREKVATVLNNLGNIAHVQGEYENARQLHEESLAIVRELGDANATLSSLVNLGITYQSLGDLDRAMAYYEEARTSAGELGNQRVMACSLSHLGKILVDLGDIDGAARFHRDGLALYEELDDRGGMAQAQLYYSNLEVRLGNREQGLRRLRASLNLFREVGDRIGIASVLEGVASLLSMGTDAAPEHATLAAELMGVADAIRRQVGARIMPEGVKPYEKTMSRLRATLGDEGFEEAMNRGGEMELDAALEAVGAIDIAPAHKETEKDGSPDEATGAVPAGSPPAASQGHAPLTSPAESLPAANTLTPRELEVLRLVAGGLTDAEAGEKLFISTRTVNAHLRSIYGKLGVTSRIEATEFARTHGLA